ncbi:MAG: hypothetical protein D6741_17840, partial [Planctomycetota bacterium]
TYHRLVYLLHQELPANPRWTLPESVLLFDESEPESVGASARDEQSNLRLFVDRVLVDGRPAIWRIAEVEGKPSLLVNLPDTVPEKSLVVEYRVFGKPVAPLARVRRITPKPSFEVLESAWEVLLPPGYRGLSRDEYARWGSPPRRWLPRLFGPLVREESDKPFLPEEVWALVRDGKAEPENGSGRVSDRRLVMEKARRWMQVIDVRLKGTQPPEETLEQEGPSTDGSLTWGALLTYPVSVAESTRAAVSVLVDVDALSAVGIGALAPVTFEGANEGWGAFEAKTEVGPALSHVDRLFRHAGLVVVVLDGRMLLTTRERLPYIAGRVVRREGPIVEIDVEPEKPLFRKGAADSSPVELIGIDTWCRLPSTESRKPAVGRTETVDTAPQGWTIVPVPTGDTLPEILVVDEAAWQTGRWVAFLCAFALFWWLLGRYPRLLV